MRRRKGQAALEFLSTYGWAILVVLVMIGALSYFGVTNPKKYLPDRCIFKTGIECQDFTVISTGASSMDVRFTLRNGLGNAVVLGPVNATYGAVVQDCTLDGGASTTIPSGESRGFTCAFAAGNPGIGQSIKAPVALTYRFIDGVYNQVAYGELSTTVQ